MKICSWMIFFKCKVEKKRLGHKRAPKSPKKIKNGALGLYFVEFGGALGDPRLQNGALGAVGGGAGLQNEVSGALGAPLGDP